MKQANSITREVDGWGTQPQWMPVLSTMAGNSAILEGTNKASFVSRSVLFSSFMLKETVENHRNHQNSASHLANDRHRFLPIKVCQSHSANKHSYWRSRPHRRMPQSCRSSSKCSIPISCIYSSLQWFGFCNIPLVSPEFQRVLC